MRLTKRKILLWVAVALLGLAVVLSSLTLFHANRASMRALDYARRNAGAPARAAQLAARLGAALPPPAFTPAAASAPAPTTASLFRDLGAIHKDYEKLERDSWEVKDRTLDNARLGGIGGTGLFLPAADFLDEGPSGPPRGGKALLDRIRDEAQNSYLFGVMPDDAAPTSAALASRAVALLDRTRDALRAASPDAALAQAPAASGAFGLAPLVVLREARQGRPAEAGALLERLVRVKLLQRLQVFPTRMPWWDVQRLALRLAEEGLIDDAALARIDRLLLQSRLGEEQLKDLRAAATVKTIQAYENELSRMGPAQDGAWPGLVRGASRVGARVVVEPLYDAMLAWAAGDAAGYDRALRNPLSTMFILPRIVEGGFCPADQATFGGESPANDGLDQTRLILAAARHRLAQGRYPERFDELVPHYLEPGFERGACSLRVIDAGEVKAQSGGSTATLPLFIQIRRSNLTPVRLVGMYGASDRFGYRSQTNLLKPPADDSMLRYLDGSVGRMLNFMSSRSVDVFVIQAVWPRPESPALEALCGASPPSHQ